MGGEAYDVIKALKKRVGELTAENIKLGEQNWKLTLAMLERPAPVKLPPEWFPGSAPAHSEPTPEHPDGIEPGLMILSQALDERMRRYAAE